MEAGFSWVMRNRRDLAMAFLCSMFPQTLLVLILRCVSSFPPFQFLSLASNILNFITTSMLNSRNNFIRNYLSVSLSEQHMATLASIIKEVDKDGLKGECTRTAFGFLVLQVEL